MATWSDVTRYVNLRWKVASQAPERLVLVFSNREGRSRPVFLVHETGPDGEEWVLIITALGSADAVDLRVALELTAGSVCGGLVVQGSVVLLRHAVPLLHFDENELERPLELLVMAAFHLEERLTR